MLATLGGLLALPFGLALLLLPLLAGELSRPRDSLWGAVVLLQGLVLVTSAERLSGAPMLAVLCGGLLLGRLGVEVGQGRWRQLTPEEQQRLGSWERWSTSFRQLGTTLLGLRGALAGALGSLGSLGSLRLGRPAAPAAPPARAKRWVRPEPAAPGPAEAAEQAAAEAELEASPAVGPEASPDPAPGLSAQGELATPEPPDPPPNPPERITPEPSASDPEPSALDPEPTAPDPDPAPEAAPHQGEVAEGGDPTRQP